MGRPSKKDILLSQINLIIEILKSCDKSILSIVDIGKILTQKVLPQINMPYSLERKTFLNFLLEENIIIEEKIQLPNRTMTKYIFGEVSKYELALSINPNSYLSHYTAMFLHGLTENIPKIIYTNMEQYLKPSSNTSRDLPQDNIDRAFSRPMRTTNNIAIAENFKVVLLNGKNTGNLEVIKKEINNKNLPITSIERTLIDIVTRPKYSGGVLEILNAYEEAKDKFSTGRLLATLKKLDYAYPYHQAIGFYMEKAGYSDDILKRFDKLDKKVDFYLTYQMKDINYSKRWRIHYPAYLD